MIEDGQASLDQRIAGAFVDGARSDDVARLIAEVEAAVVCCAELAERARTRALDPTLSAPDVAAARREMEDAAFSRDRMQVALQKLGDRLRVLRQQEEQHRRQLAYEKLKAERDTLAEELARVYPPVAVQLADLMGRIDTNDRAIEKMNARTLPIGAARLKPAELVARGLSGFADDPMNVPRIVHDLRLPGFQYARYQPYAWPRRG